MNCLDNLSPCGLKTFCLVDWLQHLQQITERISKMVANHQMEAMKEVMRSSLYWYALERIAAYLLEHCSQGEFVWICLPC